MFENICLGVSGEKKSENQKWFPQLVWISKFEISDFRKKKSTLTYGKALSAVPARSKIGVYQVFRIRRTHSTKGGESGGEVTLFARHFSIFFSQKILFIHPRKKTIFWTKIELVRENDHITTSNRVLNAFKNKYVTVQTKSI